MKKTEVKLILDTFEKLEKDYDITFDNDEINQKTDIIYVSFPREYEEIEVEPIDLIEIFKEIDSYEIHDFNRVTTDTISQRVVTASDLGPMFYLGFFDSVYINDIRLRIIHSPILIGLASTIKDEWSKYHPPCSPHIAIEVKYPSKDKRLSVEEEEKLIKSYFFELAHSYKVSFKFSSFEHPEDFDEEEFEEGMKTLPTNLEVHNPGMDLFIKANQSISSDLKFLTYYKVFEYFAPIYSKIDAFEAMRKKLDSSNSNSLSANFIGSIFDLAKNYEKSLRDKELIKSLIDNTFDLVDIYESLPILIRKKAGIENLEYKTKKDVKDRVIIHLGNVLYSTRNAIVHAKSNYEATGIECTENELEELNEFMHMACYSTIKWYNRLPEHLKIT